ncbi:MAG TPA: D-2-hydroxyacid dehydrogenase [Dehalococcoidia bacterium]|nr:D-2-hydroxyacid dehydrogenase [Dehalococcoidia bacterium]
MTNVVITMPHSITEGELETLHSLDSRLRVAVLDREQRRFLRTPGDGSDPADRALRDLLAEAEVIAIGWDWIGDLPRRAPKLKWLHTTAAGVDAYLRGGAVAPGVLFTSGNGPSAVPIAEYVLMAILALAKGAPAYVRQQQEHRWQSGPGFEVRGQTVGIVGYGHIGGEAGRLAKAIGCRVIGIRRSVEAPQENAEGADLLLPPRDLPRLLAESDFVVLTAPATAETAVLIDAAALEQMKPSAYLINVARGSLVDEQALIDALKRGRIAGAALDVFAQEPLPPESELWDLPQVLVTPHHSSASQHTRARQAALFLENLRRYLHGERLLNVVDPRRGY